MSLHLPEGYMRRMEPEFFDDAPTGVIWQPDVYDYAAKIAETCLGRRIVDLGCGNGQKLMAVRKQYGIDTIGIDLDVGRASRCYPKAEWQIGNLDRLEFNTSVYGVYVLSDVLEHLLHPDEVLMFLGSQWHIKSVVMSTPDRAKIYDAGHLGPPANRAHVQEWTAEEFRGFVHEHLGPGWSVLQTWTRANSISDAQTTILVEAAR